LFSESFALDSPFGATDKIFAFAPQIFVFTDGD